MEPEYIALTVGLSDELFTTIQLLLATHRLRLIPSLTVKDASQLLSQQMFHLLIINIKYLRNIQQIDWLNGIRRISFAPMIVMATPHISEKRDKQEATNLSR